MAEFKERPSVGQITVTVRIGREEQKRSGPSLDDVLRVLLWDLKEASAWSTNEASLRLGLPLSTLQTILDQDRNGTSLEVLSKICAAMKTNPDVLFQSYEGFSPETRQTVRFAEDAVFDRFRAVLSVKQAKI